MQPLISLNGIQQPEGKVIATSHNRFYRNKFPFLSVKYE
jgi:hypothetical protein